MLIHQKEFNLPSPPAGFVLVNPELALIMYWSWRRNGFRACEVTRWTGLLIGNTWRTLGWISQPQGCDYTVFLTSAMIPSHPKTHKANVSTGHAAAPSSSPPDASGRLWGHPALESESPAAAQEGRDQAKPAQEAAWINAPASLRPQSDKEPSGERAFLHRRTQGGFCLPS